MIGRDAGSLRGRDAASWNSHALLTLAALKSFPCSRLEEPVVVTDLRDFLERAEPELNALILWYWGLLGERTDARPPIRRPPENVETEADFLAVLHLHPNTRLQYVRLRAQEEVDPDSPHDPSRDGPPGSLYLDSPLGTVMTAYQILFTYSDEPDWGMDQDLFSLQDHPYGLPPFGITNGIGSQGPFHMAFLHENTLLMRILPALAGSFLPERVRVFFALAELAFAKGYDYWGWRFTAWATHYLQDVTTPYHARTFPPAVLPAIGRLLHSTNWRGWPTKIRDILKTHHILFEGIVHLLLNQAVKKRLDHPFPAALAGVGNLPGSILPVGAGSGERCEEDKLPRQPRTQVPQASPRRLQGDAQESSQQTRASGLRRAGLGPECSFDTEIGEVLEASSEIPSSLASGIDEAMMALFSGRRIDDHRYRTETELLETNFDLLRRVGEDEPVLLSRFLDLTCECLAVTGRVTRYAVHRLYCFRYDKAGPAPELQGSESPTSHFSMMSPSNPT